ncbi:MAG: anthranilate phosphoribosyltransferase [Acidimicrobiia bacterium]
MRETLDVLLEGTHLTADQADDLVSEITSGEHDPALVGALLVALRAKGETADEVRGLARGMRRLARAPELDGAGAVDVVGTGGDGSGSLNLSTGAALLTAAAGARVVKHGNRSMSSQSGSADVLEQLGVPMPMDEADAGEFFARYGFTFLFAPYYHPAMGAVVPVRKALGVRTVFNLLGPLTNPGRPDYAVIGAWSLETARLMAGAIAGSDMKRAFVCHGSNGWDEPTPVSPFHLLDVSDGSVRESVVDPRDYGLEMCPPSALAGGTPEQNAAGLRDALGGSPGAHRDALVLGTGLALHVSGHVAKLDDGLAAAAEAIDDGRASSLIEAIAGGEE